MDKLQQKYRNDNLTPDELRRLREEVKAAVLLPLFMIATVYLYQENTVLSQKDFVATTGKGEQVTISLPDGTQVTLNAESRLSYNLSNFNSDERRVAFDGEGYFRVAKNPSSPFSITAKGLKVSVLGTTFNLRARSADLDQIHGTVTVEESSYTTDASAWRRGELVFRNVPFAEVLEEIEEIYHVSIAIETKGLNYQDDLFTGVLSRTNINEVLEVIEHSYHLKATLKDGTIRLVNLH